MDFMEKFNDSYQAVLGTDADAAHFFDVFYKNFIGKSPEIQSKFVNTDFQHQIKMLRVSLNYMVNFFVSKKSSPYLEEIAALHGKVERDISAELYDVWVDSLMETLMELYPNFDRTIELAWRIVLAPGIEFMKFHYDP